MPTPLEMYVGEVMRSPTTFSVDGSRMAVGTDMEGYSPLLEGVKWIINANANVYDLEDDWVMMPQCLSYDIVFKGGTWSEERNLKWVRDITAATNPPHLCHVFHANAARALLSAKRTCSRDYFYANYRGKKNATFKEVDLLLAAGYNKVTDFGRAEHAILWRN